VWDLKVTDARIQAGPPVDTLGFGILPVLLIFGIPAILTLIWVWKNAARGLQRTIAAAEILLFVGSTAFYVWTYTILKARVFK
jgi:hypothetical protein